MKSNSVINRKRVINMTLSLLSIFFVACGGGGGTDSTPSDSNMTNNQLTANAGKDITVFANEGVKLTASTSYHEDNLTYKWTQTDGKAISISNATSKELTFIAPSVESNTSLTFKVDIKNSEGKSASDEVNVKILKVIKADNRQEVLATKEIFKAVNSMIEIPFLYNVYPSTLTTTGLSIRIYWDNNKINFKDIKNPYLIDYMKYSPAQEDTLNEDSDDTTTHYITISWINVKDGKWLTPNLPVNLMTPVFEETSKKSFTTHINLRRAFESPGTTFYSKAVEIQF